MLDNAPFDQARRRGEPAGSFDLWLLVAAAALAALGLVMVASSSIAIADGHGFGDFHYLARHVAFLLMGLCLAGVVMRIELADLQRYSLLGMLVGFALLLAVFLPGIGHSVNGSTRWIWLGVSNFQAVEAVKLLLVVYLASYLVRRRDQVQRHLLGVVKPLLLTAMLVTLLLLQPDFGSSALLLAITVGMIWLGGARLRDLLLLSLPLVPALAWAALAEPYRVKRFTSFLNPWADPYNDGFQLTQALIAIGRGEWFGVGLGASIQKLYYLPEAHTDFIFAVIAEELGLLGIVLVLGLYVLLAGRAFVLGMRAIERGLRFAGYCAFGIALWLSLQALVSIGVNLGVLPTKGLTLPLVSSGGSSVLMTCVAVGLLLRVSYELSRAQALVTAAASTAPAVSSAEAVPAPAARPTPNRPQGRRLDPVFNLGKLAEARA